MAPDSNEGSPLRNALRTVLRGFLLGVGFGLAMVGVSLVMWHVAANRSQAAMGDVVESGRSAAKNLTLSDVRELKHDGVDVIVGTVTNSGKVAARGVEIQADLFDHGKFVDQYSTYVSGTLEPGISKNFKISCGCKDSPPADHDSYKLEVTSGY